MLVNDLKYNLIDKLISVRDLNILQKINDLIGNVDIDKPVFKVSDAQRQMLMKSEERPMGMVQAGRPDDYILSTVTNHLP